MDKDVPSESEEVLQDISTSLKGFPRERRYLVPILQTIQERCSYLPGEAIKMVSRHLEMMPCEVYGVATFYNRFRFNPPGRHPIKVCLGTACHVRGGDIVLENFERKLGIKEGQTTPDREYSIERVACIGCCALAPVAVVEETVHGHMAPSKVEGILLGHQIEKDRQEKEPSSENGEE